MSNQEIYDKAVTNGLEFSYFHGEEDNPFNYAPDCDYWEAELMAAQSNNADEAIEDFEELSPQDIPEFIAKSNASEASKATAYLTFREYLMSIPAPIKVSNPKLGPFADYF